MSDISEIKFTYYKQPRRVEFVGISNPYTGTISPVDIESEFNSWLCFLKMNFECFFPQIVQLFLQVSIILINS